MTSAVKALWIVLVTEGTPTNRARTVVSVSAAAAAAKPKNVFPLLVVVRHPVPAVPPSGLPSASQNSAAPTLMAPVAFTTLKGPDGQTPGLLAAIGVLATPQRAL